MSLFNHAAKEIHCKIVYYGPSLGGKTTNIQWIFDQTSDQKSKMHEEGDGRTERTMFFDFLPLYVGEIRGFKTRFHLYSVPGQIDYDTRRRLVLKGLDGVVFVADSQPERMDENLLSLKNLEKNLEYQGYDIHKIPLVFQYNKRDLPNVSSIAEMRSTLNRFNFPDFEAIANRGVGVQETFSSISKVILSALKGVDSL